MVAAAEQGLSVEPVLQVTHLGTAEGELVGGGSGGRGGAKVLDWEGGGGGAKVWDWEGGCEVLSVEPVFQVAHLCTAKTKPVS